MDKNTISETIVSLGKTAMEAWLNGNPMSYLIFTDQAICWLMV